MLVVCAACTVMGTHAAQTPEARVLSAAISPGTVAQLARLPPSAASDQRLIESAAHQSAEVRAAAARVVFVSRRTAAVPALLAALQRETAGPARFEQARAIGALGGPEDERQILERWEVTRDVPTLSGLASGRAASTLALLPRVRELVSSPYTLARLLLLATRRDTAVLTQVVEQAHARADDVLLDAALSAAREARFELPPASLAAVLRQHVESPLAAVAMWHVVSQWSEATASLPQPLRAALADVLPEGIGEDVEPDVRIVYELVSRAMGRAPSTDQRWSAVLRQPTTMTSARIQLPAVRALFSQDELATLAAAHDIEPPRPSSPTSILVGRSATALTPSFTTLGGYPPGFISSVLKAAKCSMADAAGQGAGGVAAEVTLTDDGRVFQTSLVETGASANCKEAALVLFATYVPGGVVKHGERKLLMLPFVEAFVACTDVPVEAGSETPLSTPAALSRRTEIKPPKKIRDRRPIYPQGALQARVEGVVIVDAIIAPTGCVHSAAIIRSVHAQLDWESAKAVAAWQFAPAMVDDKPATIIMSVTVNFTLER